MSCDLYSPPTITIKLKSGDLKIEGHYEVTPKGTLVIYERGTGHVQDIGPTSGELAVMDSIFGIFRYRSIDDPTVHAQYVKDAIVKLIDEKIAEYDKRRQRQEKA